MAREIDETTAGWLGRWAQEMGDGSIERGDDFLFNGLGSDIGFILFCPLGERLEGRCTL